MFWRVSPNPAAIPPILNPCSTASWRRVADRQFFSAVNDPAVGGDWIGRVALAPGSPAVRIARTSGAGPSLVTDGARVYWVTSNCDITSATP